MANDQRLTGTVALTRLVHVVMEKKGKSGMVKGLFIPIDANFLETQVYTNKEGKEVTEIGIPVSIVIKPETDQRGQDGFIGKSIPNATWKAADDAKKKDMQDNHQPILSNLKDWSRSSGIPTPQNNDAGGGQTFNADEDDDLPF